MSAAVHAKGTALAVEGPPATYTQIAECKSITGPQFEGAVIDVTTHSTVGNYREFKANILDPGSLDFEINWVGTSAQHKALLADQAAQTEKNYKLTTKDSPAAVFIFACQVIRYNFSFPVDNVQTASISLKIIGPPTLPT